MNYDKTVDYSMLFVRIMHPDVNTIFYLLLFYLSYEKQT